MIQFKMLKNKKGELRSRFGTEKPWVVGKWKHVKGRIVLCANGFHCSPHPAEAHRYCTSKVVAMVQVKGDAAHYKRSERQNKSAWRSMKVLGVYTLSVKDLKAFMKFAVTLPQDYGTWDGKPEFPYTRGFLDAIRETRRVADNAINNATRGHKNKNLEAMTQWWIDRAATEMKAIG